MRTALIVLAVVLGGVPASLAHGKSAGTAQTQQKPATNAGISVAVPTGKVTVGPKLDGEPIYVRRSTVRDGITIVEVSTTPFAPVLAANEAPAAAKQLVVPPDQPAGW